jgi:putative nucleotidyltransferase with HDIG domain
MFYSGLRIHTDGVRVPRPLAPPPERTRRARAGIAIIAVAAGVALAWHAAGLVALILTAPALGVFLMLAGARRRQEAAGAQALDDEARSAVTVMLETLAMRSGATARHSAAVARYARLIAAASGLPARDHELVHTAGLLHDIGKLAFPDELLGGENPTGDDWDLIRAHPERGAVLVESVPGYTEVAEIVRCHHERPDGRGYPRRLTGAEIPELARILAVAECFDAMTGGDRYRAPLSFHAAIAELRRVAGTQLDARYVEALADILISAHVALREEEEVRDAASRPSAAHPAVPAEH